MIITALVVGMLLVGSLLTFIALGFSSPIPWLFLLVIGVIIAVTRIRENSRFVTWKDEYSVGIESIDNDHRKLLNLINQLQTAVYYQTGRQFEQEALKALVDYTKTHFDREEKLMSDHDYPGFENHQFEHHKMIVKVEQFVTTYQKEGHKVIKDIAEFLRHWLINHINKTDKAYSSYLRDKGVR